MRSLVRDAEAPDGFKLKLFTTLGEGPAYVRHPRSAALFLGYLGLIFSGSYNITHLNISPGLSTWRKMLYARVSRAAGLKVVLHFHGAGYDEWFREQSGNVQKKLVAEFSRADAIIVLGEYWRRFFSDELGLAADKVHIISNGVPDPITESDDPTMTHGAVPQISFLGEVGVRKGVPTLLQAAGALKKSGVDFRLVIAGNGDLDKYRQEAADLGLADIVSFPGWVGPQEAKEILLASDVFCLPSTAENQPLSILEAMAASLPVVSTSIGAIPEQVVEGEGGYLVSPGDAAGLEKVLHRLVTDEEERCRMGAFNRKRFTQKYVVSAMLSQLCDLYRTLLHDRS